MMSNASPTNEYVLDTVALILRLEARQMGTQALQHFTDIEQGNSILHVPSMVFAEILYLSQRKRITATLNDVQSYMNRFTNCIEAPLTFAIITTAQQISDIPELHDRLSAATAAHLNAPLLTNDTTISSSSFVKTIW